MEFFFLAAITVTIEGSWGFGHLPGGNFSYLGLSTSDNLLSWSYNLWRGDWSPPIPGKVVVCSQLVRWAWGKVGFWSGPRSKFFGKPEGVHTRSPDENLPDLDKHGGDLSGSHLGWVISSCSSRLLKQDQRKPGHKSAYTQNPVSTQRTTLLDLSVYWFVTLNYDKR